MTAPSSVSRNCTDREGGSEKPGISMKRIHVTVSGVVQGVGFRFFTRHLAERFELHGFVRNREDGRVELEAQGSEGALSAFLEELGSRPPRNAHVSGVEVEELPPKEDLGGFRITY